MCQLVWRSLPLPGCRRTRISGVTGNLCMSQNIAPLPLSLVFFLPHKLFSLVWGKIHHKPIFSYKVLFLLEILCPLGFQAELHGWRHLGLCWMCCIFPESITKGDSGAVFLQSQALLTAPGLLPGCSPLPTEGGGCVGWSVLVYMSPLLPIFTFPGYQQKYFLSTAALFPVFCCGTDPLISLFSSLTTCKVF